MTVSQIEKRLTALEAEVASLKAVPKARNRWWDAIAGTFADNPLFEAAMRNGRAWREQERATGRNSKKRPGSKQKAGR